MTTEPRRHYRASIFGGISLNGGTLLTLIYRAHQCKSSTPEDWKYSLNRIQCKLTIHLEHQTSISFVAQMYTHTVDSDTANAASTISDALEPFNKLQSCADFITTHIYCKMGCMDHNEQGTNAIPTLQRKQAGWELHRKAVTRITAWCAVVLATGVDPTSEWEHLNVDTWVEATGYDSKQLAE